MESPSMARARAPRTGVTPGGWVVMPTKYGGFFT